MSDMKPTTTDKIVRLPKELLASDRFFVVLLQLHEDKSHQITGAMTVAGGRSNEQRYELQGTREGNELSLWTTQPSGERTPAIHTVLADDGSFTIYPPPGSSPILHFQPSNLRRYHAVMKQRWG